MRKKITMLLALLLTCVGVTRAAVTDLPEMTTSTDSIKWYTIKNVRTQKFATYAGDNASMTQQTTASAASLFYFTGTETDGVATVKVHNYAAGEKLCAAYNSWTEAGIDWYIKAQETGVSISNNTDGSGTGTSWNDARGEGQVIEYWTASDVGSAWEVSLVTDFSALIDVPAAKTAALETLNNLKKIDILFTAATIEKAIEDINAVNAASTGLDDLNAAVEAIDAIVDGVYGDVDGKNVRFTTLGRNTDNGGLDITAAVAGAGGTANSGDAGIWTLSNNGDGTFKMYNFVSNLYMGATSGSGQRVSTCAAFADAAPYTLNAQDTNKVNLLNNGNTLHADGWYNIVQWNDNSAGASIWKVIACDPIVLTREQYGNAVAAAASLPYAIQEAYGLVTDAANYYSNWLSTAEGSYAALLDNASDTYFHSAYTNEATADTAETHYIQADLGDGKSVDEFYFYMAPRTQNSNNRPSNVTVSGSNDNIEYTRIAEITTTLDGTTTPYFSAKLGTDGTNYRYIRLTVNTTNNSTKFFTLSELYFFPATDDVTSLIDSYNSFATSSITETAMSDAATALINAETTLALANIKKEIAAILEANESNHAETPALGQYTTEAYNALNTAYTAGDATQESLENAIAAFKIAKNNPVFTIDGVVDYATGKSIYDNPNSVNGKGNTHYFKATNVYDKTMWWALDMTETTVDVIESVGIRNVGTGVGFWGSSTIKITETSENDGAGIADDGIFLFYTTDNTTPIHAQNDNQLICRWGSTEASSGSAWKFIYIGNSYDLNKLTDDHVTALAALKTAYDAKAYCAEVEIGSGVGQYTGDKDAVVDVLNAGKVILDKSLSEQATLDLAEINSAAEAIEEASALQLNMPQTGFYRVKSMNANDENKRGKYWQVNADATALELNATMDEFNSIVYYADDKTILNYGTGLFLNNYNTPLAVGEEAKSWTIAANNKVLGAYALYRNGDRYCLSDWSGLTYGQNDENAAWALEAVEVLPLKVLAAGYATLYAPVALTIPAEGVAVYTATVEGSTLTLKPVEGTIPANTGVIIEAAEGTYNFTVATDVTAIEGNAFTGALAKSAKNAAAKVYTLQKPAEKEVGFYLFNGTDGTNTTYINGFRAWVELPLDATVQGLRITRGDTEDTTGIEQLAGDNAEVVIYDLAGRRVEKMEKGIYIVNGKKVVIR